MKPAGQGNTNHSILQNLEPENPMPGHVMPGQDLVVAGFVGLDGARRIVEEKEAELLSRFSRGYLQEIQRIPEEDQKDWDNLRQAGAICWKEAGEGGIHTALWNISETYGIGFQIDLCRIPIKQSTIEICEFYELDPYDLYCSHCAVLITDNGGHTVSRLEQGGIPAAWIGTLTKGIARKVFYDQVCRYMDRPAGDALYKIIERKAL